MIKRPVPGRGNLLILLTMGLILVLSCNALSPADPDEPAQQPGPGSTIQPTEEEPEQEGDCPQDTTVLMDANHNFQVDTGFGPWQWQASGTVNLQFDEDGTPNTMGPQSFSGQVSGELAADDTKCMFTAPAEIELDAAGSCVDGIVTLTITEQWIFGEYEWVCDEDAFQFQLPANPPSIHENVVFDLRGELDGVTTRFPFGGGSGAKNWTIYPPPPPLVPASANNQENRWSPLYREGSKNCNLLP